MKDKLFCIFAFIFGALYILSACAVGIILALSFCNRLQEVLDYVR